MATGERYEVIFHGKMTRFSRVEISKLEPSNLGRPEKLIFSRKIAL